MKRIGFGLFGAVALLATALIIFCGAAAQSQKAGGALSIGQDVQLFLDDYVVGEKSGLTTQFHQPVKHPEPILSAARFKTTQPYLGVVYDEGRKVFRLWYNRADPVWHTESEDGINWDDPKVAWDIPRSYGCGVVDDGPGAKDPARRFKIANWQATRELEDKAGEDSGIYVGFSPDGFNFVRHDTPVLRTHPNTDQWGPNGETPPTIRHGVGDTADVFWDPIRKHYAMAVKVHGMKEDGWAKAPKAGGIYRRLVGMSVSDDFVNWEKPWRICVPDEKDEGLLEFYGMGGIHARGSLLVGYVRVLRDDLPCDPGGPVDGIGYTTLAICRDGKTWTRLREPFVDRGGAGTWDHAMAWMGDTAVVGDELYLFYGGYKRGHKVERDTERQIGMAKMRRDGYVSLDAGAKGGEFLSKPVVFDGKRLTLNVDVAAGGSARVELQDASGKPIKGFALKDCEPIRSNKVEYPVEWKNGANLAKLADQPVRVKIALKNAKLYGFQFME